VSGAGHHTAHQTQNGSDDNEPFFPNAVT
jgi:hypothetical protein